MSALLILGAGGHAKVVADIARQSGWTISGFVDELKPERAGQLFDGAPILGEIPAADRPLEIALAIGDCRARLRALQRTATSQYRLPPLVHPRAIVAPSARMGAGTQVMAGAILNPDAVLGRAVIVNTAATVDHDCEIADGVHLAPGVHLAGQVTIGEGAFLGIGAVVKPGVRIGAGCVVGAGAVVLRDLPDNSTVAGVPARPLDS